VKGLLGLWDVWTSLRVVFVRPTQLGNNLSLNIWRRSSTCVCDLSCVKAALSFRVCVLLILMMDSI
jgi:hypothetical protein